MIIRSIRLKNIKSYGEGTDGTGVTVNFESGINRIAGKNGHGKTTLIESLGHALFLTRPAYEENFQVDTYLLRSGSRSGEIAITFEHDLALYRLERGVGQSGIRAKVIALADNSIEAEGDKEVSDYICSTLGLSGPDRLSELFSKLIGVKQGRLTWPFDSKPSEAKRFFEPLLDVQVFRDCFDKLLPVITLFAKDLQDLDVKLAGVNARLQDRADSREKVEEAVRNRGTQELLVETLNGQKTGKVARRLELEAYEKAFLDADSRFGAAERENGVAAQKEANARQRVKESDAAAGIAAESKADYDAFMAAEKALNELRQQQQARDKLVSERADAVNRRTEKTGKAKACVDKVKVFTRQAEEAEVDMKRARARQEKILEGLTTTRDAHLLEEKKVEALGAARDNLNHWMSGCQAALAEQQGRHQGVTGAWAVMKNADPEALGRAEQKLDAARSNAEALAVALSEAQAQESTLASQLRQIDKGVCPFLQEPCLQFKPEKVKADLKKQQLSVSALKAKLAQARSEVTAAEKVFTSQREKATRLGEDKVGMKAELDQMIKVHAGFRPAAVDKWLEAALGALPKLQKVIRLPELPALTLRQVLDLQGTLNTGALDELVKAEESLLEQAGTMMDAIEPECQRLVAGFEAARDKRIKDQGDAAALADQAKTLVETHRKNLANAEKEEKARVGHVTDTDALSSAIGELDKKLSAYSTLDSDIRLHENGKKTHEPGYTRHVGASGLAKELPGRKEALAEFAALALELAAALAARRMDRDNAAGKCDSVGLKCLREDENDLVRQLGEAQAVLAGIKREEKVQQSRLKEWHEASGERDSLKGEMERLGAATAITEKARSILKAAAPFVAQSICTRIAGEAQKIFNQVNHETVLLDWNSDRYSLTVSPGDRRFAMLSGGEQTKLALAMTLAMIHEFSGLRFCIFDEPTYGVDAESRQRLADAILQLQTAAGFDQLLLVSHDDSFEGKIEHTVLMQKTSASGSYAEIIS
jgi:exonuclease SbcC